MENSIKTLNFLDFPNWAILSKKNTSTITLQKSIGLSTYEMIFPEGLPTHFDKIVLFFLLHKYFQEESSLALSITHHEIIKKFFLKEKKSNQSHYNEIIFALKGWQSSYIRTQDTILNQEEKTFTTINCFSILSSVILDKNTPRLTVTLNELFVQRLSTTIINSSSIDTLIQNSSRTYFKGSI